MHPGHQRAFGRPLRNVSIYSCYNFCIVPFLTRRAQQVDRMTPSVLKCLVGYVLQLLRGVVKKSLLKSPKLVQRIQPQRSPLDRIPPKSWDSHMHIFHPARYPLSSETRYIPKQHLLSDQVFIFCGLQLVNRHTLSECGPSLQDDPTIHVVVRKSNELTPPIIDLPMNSIFK